MNFIFYDLETTGRSTHWDQIIQVAAILTDSQLNIKDQINQICRIKTYCIPNPEALLVNKIPIRKLTESNLSLFQLVKNISDTFKKWSPAIFIGYNSILYDEEMLRNSFFSNLIDPYLTIKNQNLRADLINTIRASNYFHPDIIKSELNQRGNPIFKLEKIAKVNGIANFTAHDALGDTSASIELSKLIKEKLPNIWEASTSKLEKNILKNSILDKPFCYLETFFGNTKIFPLSFIGYHPQYKWALCFDLSNDPYGINQMHDHDFNSFLEASPKVIRNIKLHKSPLILPIEYINKIESFQEISQDELLNRHNFLSQNTYIKDRIVEFYENKSSNLDKNQSQENIYAEETIYRKFISKKDALLATDFHNTSWDERLLIRNKFSDERLNYFANLIIYEERPQLLDIQTLKKIQRNICERLLSNNNEKWLTIYNAYKIVDDLRAKYSDKEDSNSLKLLEQINMYLETVEKKIQKYTI